MSQSSQAILKTLAYSDVFDYPLTEKEIWQYLISEKIVSFEEIQNELHSLLESKRISKKDDYYFLQGRKKIVGIRKNRRKWSQKKLKIAKRVTSWLKTISWVKMIAVTGALAMKNAKKDDDIDLFFITASNRLWLSRGIIVSFLRLFGLYRRPQKIKDMICPNMFLDKSHLKLPKEEQNLFTAHEVCQLKLIWQKDKIYQKFLKENRWVTTYLANWRI